MCLSHRRLFIQLAFQLWKENKKEEAVKALDYCEQMIPNYNVPHDSSSQAMAELYYQLGEKEKGDQIINIIADSAIEYVSWYLGMNDMQLYPSFGNLDYYLTSLNTYIKTMSKYQSDLLPVYTSQLNRLGEIYKMRIE
jgi:hypothetical protein